MRPLDVDHAAIDFRVVGIGDSHFCHLVSCEVDDTGRLILVGANARPSHDLSEFFKEVKKPVSLNLAWETAHENIGEM